MHSDRAGGVRCRAIALVVLASSAALACGQGSPGPSYQPPWVTLRASVNLLAPGSVSVYTNARLALIWRRNQVSTGAPLIVSYEKRIDAESYASFSFPVADLPPLDAMNALADSEHASYAVGSVVVYVDKNSNGQFDVREDRADGLDDIVIAALERTAVTYLEGTVEDAVRAGIPQGFGMVFSADLDTVAGCGVPCDWTPRKAGKPAPLDTELVLEASKDPQLSALFCRTGAWLGYNSTCTDPTCPPPHGSEITCSADNRAFTFRFCSASALLCREACCLEDRRQLQPDDEIPVDWPCQ
jgi:hypothetical protein